MMKSGFMQELDEPEYGHLFVKRAVTRALDKHNHEREMSSILLSALYGEVSSIFHRLQKTNITAMVSQQPYNRCSLLSPGK